MRGFSKILNIYTTALWFFLGFLGNAQGTSLGFELLELNTVFPNTGVIVQGAVENGQAMCFNSNAGRFYLERGITFKLGGSLQDPSNEYIVEYTLSTDTNWRNAVRADITQQPAADGKPSDTRQLKFALPDNFKGGVYKIRLRATNPARVGEIGNGKTPHTFGFYIPNHTPLVLNRGQNVTLCGNQGQEISVDRKDEGRYIWTRDGKVLQGENKATLKIQAGGAGLYGVKVDYGTCSQNIPEGTIRVSSNTISDFRIEGGDARRDASISICPGAAQVLKASEQKSDAFYSWKRGSTVVLEGIGKFELPLSGDALAGDYTVSMGQGCAVESKKLSIKLKSDFTSKIEVPDGSYMLIHGKEKLMRIQTGASKPTYQWFKNDAPIAGATSPTFTTSEPGTYYAKVTSGDECSVTKETEKRIIIQYPVSYSIETTQNFRACDLRAQVGIRSVIAKGAVGDGEPINASDWKHFTFKWFKDGRDLGLEGSQVTVTKEQHGSGDFSVQATKESSVLGEIKDSNSQKIQFSDATPVSVEVHSESGGKMEPAGPESDKAGAVIKCANENLNIIATVNQPTANYKWYFKGGNNVDYLISEGKGLTQITTLSRGASLTEVKTGKPFQYNDNGVGTYWVVMREDGKSCDATAQPVQIASETFFANWAGDPKELADTEIAKRNLIIFYPKSEKKPVLTVEITPANAEVEITWIRNGVTIDGATGRSYTVTQTGRYYAQVKKVGGCAEPVTPYTKHVAEPDEYDLSVGYKENASPCGRKSAVLALKELRAIAWRRNDRTGEELTDDKGEKISVINVVGPDQYDNYEFQWYKDGEQILGAHSSEYEIKDTDKEKGTYYLSVLAKNSSNQVAKESNRFDVLYIEMPQLQFSGKKTLEPNKEMRLLLNIDEKFKDISNYIYIWKKGDKVIKSSVVEADRAELHDRLKGAGYEWQDLVRYQNKPTEGNFSYVVENVGNLDSSLYKNTLGTYEVVVYSRKHLGCESKASFTVREQDTTIGIITDNGADNGKEIVGKLDKGQIVKPAEGADPKVIRVEVDILKGEDQRASFVVKDPDAEKFLLVTKRGCSEIKSEGGGAFALSYPEALGLSSYQSMVSGCANSSIAPSLYTPTDDEFVFVYSLDSNNKPATLFVVAIKAINLSSIQNTVLLNSSNMNNRTLILPEEYLDAQVEIYAPNGEKVFGVQHYKQRSWPNDAALKYCEKKGSATIFHIVITKGGKEKSGSITVLN